MARRIIEYTVLAFERCDDIAEAVNGHLAERWEIYGNPFGVGTDSYIHQALVKYDIPPEPAGNATSINEPEHRSIE